jgi:phospholipid/cholesterol/gamma-HCH transport system substrate-binding protein
VNRRRPFSAGIAILSVVVLTTACTLQTAGAPKGALRITATFDDAQHLVAGHAVKASDVQVGTVTKVALDGYKAKITLSIVDGRKIPVGTTAVLGQTSLLGENYVQLRFPEHFDAVRGPFMRSGSAVPETQVDPSLEHVAEQGIEVLAAIQGGDLATIVDTGATGLGGRGEEMQRLIHQLADVGHVFGAQNGDLAAVVDGLGSLGSQLADHSDDIGALLDTLSGATRTLAGERDSIVSAVRGLTLLARALNDHVLDPHGRQLTTIVAQLDPIAASLGANTATLGKLLSGLAVTAERAPHAFNSANNVLLYAWIDSFRANNGTTTPLPGGAAAINSLLQPPTARPEAASR